ncbi:single-stranded DNA-binding protein [Kocuria rhizophila]|uniref:single-stranded DNA-binding protein n=1 Tax=Kocuria rhizophila TaxID=72000 RepID=UPI002ED09D9A|nr:single-stranded DNA-binding protein [Kocuria rhizophila]
MSEHVTLRGFVGKDPESRLFEDGTMVARFRLATTTRRFDAASNTWQDGSTNWYTVRCFRTLAMHVMASVRCGHPVVVTGKLGINEWQSETGPRTVVQVDAAAVGHDLSFGTANFSRSGGRAQRAGSAEGAQAREDTGDGPADGASGVVRGEDEAGTGGRYRDAQSLGLGEDGYVDVTSGAVIAVDADDHTFDGLGTHGDGTAETGDAGGDNEDTAGESSTSEEREPAAAAS